ncbi:replication initiator protein A [Burkholderia multivorans]|uniref:Replication initiator protein A n=1 Tax=Burkholderia multivorans TaxID=87883 RepID=A0AB37B359_9BURK|nr:MULTISPECIES: replication initiator protein A [Burkholderia cepacia complex]MBU9236313.1 replication initiator protein A [Burkholderia multivorans]MBU9486678.1 replication initiator protein A [Burkholderia multivorans]MBU9546589.1 replication initiator protein A [Burkholderia multivorans]MBY4754880.1 replication initiator protein A [Burkholderia dolosa]MCO1362872.1 replication initiator protein A [Burkholderia multivorans]
MSTVNSENSYSLRGAGAAQLPMGARPALARSQAAEQSENSADGDDVVRLDEGEFDPEQLELFFGEQLDLSWKPREDLHSLEFPLFSLQKGKDTRVRVYRNGEQVVRIIPSGVGAANIFDKDLLVYAATLICKAADSDIPVSRRIRFKVRDFLKYTRRSTGGASYERIVDSCRRLKGTIIETNFDTTRPGANEAGIHETLRGYGLIQEYSVITYTANRKGALEVELVLSSWTYDLLLSRRILTLHPGYFDLGQGLERRLYDLAKKHCGDKLWFKIGLEKLYGKSGSAQALKYFRRDLIAAMKADKLPEFHIALDDDKAMVVFFRCDRDNRRQDEQLTASIHRELLAKKLSKWYYALRRWDSDARDVGQLELIART